jgi:hypothetical protein
MGEQNIFGAPASGARLDSRFDRNTARTWCIRVSAWPLRAFLLGPLESGSLRQAMLAVLVKETMTVIDLSAYPDWLLVLGGTLVTAFLVWLMITLLKWALWLLFFAVLIGGVGWAAWLLVR